jgi:hypothetical protein
LLLPVVLAAAQEEAAREYVVRPLDFSVAVPAGWKAEQGPTGMVASDAQQNGFIVSREPFLHDPETFAEAWRAQLAAGKIDAKVERAKAGGRDAWRAVWTADKRQIEVWRIHVPDLEMLYNVSFSGAAGFDLATVAEATLKSLKWAPPKAELKFQQKSESVTTRIQIRLPEGYEKEMDLEGFSLGGGISGGFVKKLPGYEPPRVAGRIRFRGREAGVTYITEDGREIPGGNTEKVLEEAWRGDEGEFARVLKKPKAKDTTLAGMKGCAMEATIIGKDGLPRRWLGFCGKYKQDVVELILFVDDREARLHKDLLKQVCSNFIVEK